ncbi:DUF190 domain-containing protein [Kitasatospora purpeofusca]|uniref:DUF190 domain-containing protein n=1 Tax=Kitasatospora purpeofusca TaxID=67352 RepID=UPI002252889D|nr:DUF190 domain-containing protein [Kitasatospora purpeofusca]MCX4753808.1 DUF190 domain-containing protein [Kitasatospora purpeofusca]WSR33285.1 DUF190 domain-containing protein [Kitasatospora purpeofusca]WSR41357.1 DUF190 domain-containing protein [Kitasatospora purpeofusca]
MTAAAPGEGRAAGSAGEGDRLGGPALRLTVLVGENDRHHHRPLYSEIVHRARAAGLAGASVFRGIEGFGASSLVHTARLLSLSEDLPVAVVIVDTEQRVRAFLPELDGLRPAGPVTLERCEVLRYAGPDGADGAAGRGAGEGGA